MDHFLTQLTLRWLRSRRTPYVAVNEGRYSLVHGRLQKIIAVVCFLAIGLVGAIPFMPAMQPKMGIGPIAWFWAAFGVFCWLLGTMNLLDAFLSRMEVDDRYISNRKPWRRVARVPWADVKRVTLVEGCSWYTIDAGIYGRTRFSEYMDGFQTFLDDARRRGIAIK